MTLLYIMVLEFLWHYNYFSFINICWVPSAIFMDLVVELIREIKCSLKFKILIANCIDKIIGYQFKYLWNWFLRKPWKLMPMNINKTIQYVNWHSWMWFDSAMNKKMPWSALMILFVLKALTLNFISKYTIFLNLYQFQKESKKFLKWKGIFLFVDDNISFEFPCSVH